MSDDADRKTFDDLRLVCAICGCTRPVRPFLMTHGIVVHLCGTHEGLNYLRRKGGHTFVQRLAQLWAAHGILNAQRRAALVGHLTRIRRTLVVGEYPGSYAWRRQRAYAEQRFAAGDPPAAVIAEIRDRERWPGQPPSVRTVRRWLAEARWLSPPRRYTPTALALADAAAGAIDILSHSGEVWHTHDDASRELRRLRFILRPPET